MLVLTNLYYITWHCVWRREYILFKQKKPRHIRLGDNMLLPYKQRKQGRSKTYIQLDWSKSSSFRYEQTTYAAAMFLRGSHAK